MSTTEQNMATVRAFFGAASSGDLEVLERIIDPEYVMHDPALAEELPPGLQGARELVESHRRELGDLDVTIEHQFAQGDYVATRFSVRGTHSAELAGVPPTGREVRFTGLTLSRLRDGRVVEEWEICDVPGIMRQIGALPALATA